MVLVATAPLATAEPRHEENSGRVSYKEPKDRQRDEPRHEGEWVELATPTPVKHGTEFFFVGKDAGDFSQVRIDAHHGRVFVQRARIYFDDGKTKTVELDRKLDPLHRSARIDLGGAKAIDRVVITTDTYGGTYQLFGSVGETGIAAR